MRLKACLIFYGVCILYSKCNYDLNVVKNLECLAIPLIYKFSNKKSWGANHLQPHLDLSMSHCSSSILTDFDYQLNLTGIKISGSLGSGILIFDPTLLKVLFHRSWILSSIIFHWNMEIYAIEDKVFFKWTSDFELRKVQDLLVLKVKLNPCLTCM